MGPPDDRPPTEIAQLAERRTRARHEGDFTTADRLKADIEALGWKVVDQPAGHRLEPAHPPDVEVGGTIRHGSSTSVPSRLKEPEAAAATIVQPDGATLNYSPPDAQIVRVSADQSGDLPVEPSFGELILTSGALGLAAEWNIGIRRSVGSVLVLLAPGVSADGDVVGPVVGVLADESVAVVGSDGLTSTDLRRWQPAPPGEVDALGPGLLAFRRADARQRGLLDERFVTPHHLAVWWSLVLRDDGPDKPARHAVALDIPLLSPAGEADEPASDPRARRDFYRLLDRFGQRFDLLREAVRPTAASAKARRRRR